MDRLDVQKLLTMLLRHMAGERKVWSVVRVPSVEEEDRRQLHRGLTTAKQDRTRIINRIKGLLAGHGVQLVLQGDVEAQLDQMRQWDGAPLPRPCGAVSSGYGSRSEERRVGKECRSRWAP